MSIEIHQETPSDLSFAVVRGEVLRLDDRGRKQSSPSIQELLDLLLLAEEKTGLYARQHSPQDEARNGEEASTAEALEWVETAFQDIGATLEAISRAPLSVKHSED